MEKETTTVPRSVRQQVLSKQREADCLRLRVEGHTYDEIADMLGFANRSGAQKAFKRALERIFVEEAREALVLEYERYNAMLAAVWPDVELGKPRAVRQALAVMDRIDRLFGLDNPNCPKSTQANSSSSGLPTGVIVIDIDPARQPEVPPTRMGATLSDDDRNDT
jgi:hypothetical protein